MNFMSDRWMTVGEISEYTGHHPQTIRKAYRRREFPVSRATERSHVRARKSDVDKWMQSSMIPARRNA